jgi:hypothetical protein
VLFQSADITRARSAFNLLNTLGVWLPIIAIVLLGVGVIVAKDHRRALVGAAVGVAVGMLLLALSLAVFRTIYLDAVPAAPASPVEHAMRAGPAFVSGRAPPLARWSAEQVAEFVEEVHGGQVAPAGAGRCDTQPAPSTGSYCRAMAIRRRSSGVRKWSASAASSPRSIWTQFTSPVNSLPRGP